MANWRKNFTNVPPTVKTLAIILGIVSIFGAISTIKWPVEDNVLSNIAVVPGVAISKFWTFLTAGFLETHLITFIGNALMLLGCGKYLERIWGSRNFLKFVMIIITGTNLLTYMTCIIEYYIMDNAYYLYGVQCNGLIGLVCGFLVALKQLDPEHLVFRGLFSIRIKYFSSLFIIGSLINYVIFEAQIQFLLVIYGWIISWIYLRFFKVQDGIKGDSSETFSFASFFPEFTQPIIKIISRVVFNILVLFRCCKAVRKKNFNYDLESSNFQNLIPAMPGSARAESERRRELALKTLDKRLNSSNKYIYYPVSPPPQKSTFHHHHHQSSSQNASQESSPTLNTVNNTISNSSLTGDDIKNSTTTASSSTTSSILFDSKDYSSDL